MEEHSIGTLIAIVGALIPLMDMQNYKRKLISRKIKIRLKLRIVKL